MACLHSLWDTLDLPRSDLTLYANRRNLLFSLWCYPMLTFYFVELGAKPRALHKSDH